jgi:hypothetical protein
MFRSHVGIRSSIKPKGARSISNTKGFWQDIENHRLFLEKTAIKLNIKKVEEWSGITNATILKYGGGGLLGYYSGSLTRGKSLYECDILCKLKRFWHDRDFYWRSYVRLYWRFYRNTVATDEHRLLQCCDRISNTILLLHYFI